MAIAELKLVCPPCAKIHPIPRDRRSRLRNEAAQRDYDEVCDCYGSGTFENSQTHNFGLFCEAGISSHLGFSAGCFESQTEILPNGFPLQLESHPGLPGVTLDDLIQLISCEAREMVFHVATADRTGIVLLDGEAYPTEIEFFPMLFSEFLSEYFSGRLEVSSWAEYSKDYVFWNDLSQRPRW